MDGSTNTVAPTVNGINISDLFALIERVKNNPAAGMTQWRVATMWRSCR